MNFWPKFRRWVRSLGFYDRSRATKSLPEVVSEVDDRE